MSHKHWFIVKLDILPGWFECQIEVEQTIIICTLHMKYGENNILANKIFVSKTRFQVTYKNFENVNVCLQIWRYFYRAYDFDFTSHNSVSISQGGCRGQL